jgi:hypothetical protein
MFKQKDKKKDKLGNVFDIILNGYYQYVQNLIWYYNNAPNEEPLAIVAVVAENPKIANRSVFILKESDTQTSRTDIPNDPTQINEKFLRAIAKRYPDPVNNKILVKEVPQFRGKQEMLKDYVPGECPTCNSEGNNANDNASTPSSVSSGDRIKIDGWDVGKACANIIAKQVGCKTVNGKKKCGHSKCASHVEDAIAAGGGPLAKRIYTSENKADTIHATNLRYYGILESHGFVMIDSGTVGPSGNPTIKLQAGDIAIIGKNAKVEGGKYHACMYTTSKGWVSDFIQNNMNVYGTAYPYAIYRFHNKQGTAYS